jgi:lipid A 3-O-deacylase
MFGSMNVKSFALAAVSGLAMLALPTAASANEIFGGLYIHNVDTPLTLGGRQEKGVDFQLGWRGGRIANTPLQPYVFGALHSAGQTHYAAAGISAKFGDRLYIRPGLGIAVHTGSAARFHEPHSGRIEFGSRILFAPELAVGMQIAPRVTAEASWVHISHATLFSGQNPGMDSIGIRVNLALP